MQSNFGGRKLVIPMLMALFATSACAAEDPRLTAYDECMATIASMPVVTPAQNAANAISASQDDEFLRAYGGFSVGPGDETIQLFVTVPSDPAVVNVAEDLNARWGVEVNIVTVERTEKQLAAIEYGSPLQDALAELESAGLVVYRYYSDPELSRVVVEAVSPTDDLTESARDLFGDFAYLKILRSAPSPDLLPMKLCDGVPSTVTK